MKAKVDAQLKKFVELLKKIHFNVPFTEASSQVLTYSKFLKEILSNKTKFEDHETVAMIVDSSVVIVNMLPKKFKRPGKFLYSLPNWNHEL